MSEIRDFPLRGNDEWRQQPQDVLVRAIDQQAFAQRLLQRMARLPRQVQCRRINPSPRTSRMKSNFAGQVCRAPRAIPRRAHERLQQFFVLDDRKKFQSRGADQRAAAECGAVQAGSRRAQQIPRWPECSQRQTAGQRLGDDDDVRAAMGIAGKRTARPVRPRPH